MRQSRKIVLRDRMAIGDMGMTERVRLARWEPYELGYSHSAMRAELENWSQEMADAENSVAHFNGSGLLFE